MRNPTIFRLPHAGEVTLFNRDSTSGVNDYDADSVQGGMEEIDFRQVTFEPTGVQNTYYNSVTTFSEVSRQFTISPLSGSYNYYIRGHKFTKTGTDVVTIGNIDGAWFIFFVGTTLTASQTPWAFEGAQAFVYLVYWNVTSQKAVLLNEERHGLVMDWASHRYLHYTIGLAVEEYKIDLSNYITRGDGSLDAHATVGYSDLGRVFDEDLDFLPVNSANPVNNFEQKINPILWAPVLYRRGSSGIWDKITATQFPLAWTAGQLLKYNQWTGATWQLTTMTNGYFVNVYICITEDPRHPFIAILGQSQYLSIVDAASEKWSSLVEFLPAREIKPLNKLIYKTSTTYTNQPKAVLFAALSIDELTVDNDRYTVEVGSNGNVGVGKFLERSTGAGSNDNPFIFPEASFVRYVLVQSQAGTLATVTIGIFRTTDTVNPIITMSLANVNSQLFGFSQFFSANDQIFWKITSGSINKPLVTTWIQTQLG